MASFDTTWDFAALAGAGATASGVLSDMVELAFTGAPAVATVPTAA